jgi:hypothetical protein
MVACTADGTAYLGGRAVGSCGGSVPGCKLLLEGGQPAEPFVYAYLNQVLLPGSSGWSNGAFYCPQSRGALPVPGAATIRDQVIKLLPVVRIGSAGPEPVTLVNIQTILWAQTAAARDLGAATVVSRPVQVRVRFHHAAWDFGDGDGDTAGVPGKAYDDAGDRCATVRCPHYFGHMYRRAGAVTVTLRVSWSASYSLDGVRYLPVAGGPLTGPAATLALRVRQARVVLVPNPGD